MFTFKRKALSDVLALERKSGSFTLFFKEHHHHHNPSVLNEVAKKASIYGSNY